MSKFSNHGRSGGSQTLWGLHVGKKNVQRPWQIGRFSNLPFRKIGSTWFSDRGRSGGSQTRVARSPNYLGSATMADRVVLKLAINLRVKVDVQQPWQIRWFSNSGRLEDS